MLMYVKNEFFFFKESFLLWPSTNKKLFTMKAKERKSSASLNSIIPHVLYHLIVIKISLLILFDAILRGWRTYKHFIIVCGDFIFNFVEAVGMFFRTANLTCEILFLVEYLLPHNYSVYGVAEARCRAHKFKVLCSVHTIRSWAMNFFAINLVQVLSLRCLFSRSSCKSEILFERFMYGTV